MRYGLHRAMAALVLLSGASVWLLADQFEDGLQAALAPTLTPLLGTWAASAPPLRFAMHRPPWSHDPGFMKRFSVAGREEWRPRGDVNVTSLRALSMSQGREDLYAFAHFFYARGGGTFLEMGALDGWLFSNSVGLDRVLGWRGVHIEASPDMYGNLVRNRGDQVAANVAVCGQPRVVHYADDGHPCCRGIAEFMSERNLRFWHPNITARNFSGLPEVRTGCVRVDSPRYPPPSPNAPPRRLSSAHTAQQLALTHPL
jgi:hypothetical protein